MTHVRKTVAGPSQSQPPGRLLEPFRNSATLFGVLPIGTAFGRWLGKTLALPQLKKLVNGRAIPWTPLHKAISQCKVVLVSTAGVHLAADPPFKLRGDSGFRVIPRGAQPCELSISHNGYNKSDALRDFNLVFPLERLRELESERVIGGLASEHYSFGLIGDADKLVPSMKEVARRIRDVGADLVLLVPA